MSSKIKNLASDTLVYGLFTIVGRFLTFMLTPLYVNYITDADQLNFIYYLYALIPLIIIFYSFGMESSFFRFFENDKPSTHKRAFSNAFLSIFTVSIIISGLIAILSNDIAELLTFEPIENGSLMIVIVAVIIMLDAWILIPYALLRMQRKSFKFALTKFILILIQVGLNIIFVVFMDMDAMGVLIANLIASIAGIVILFPELFKYLQLQFNKELLKEMLKFGLPTLPASIFTMILHVGDRTIIQWLSDSPKVLNIYQTNYRLAIPMLLFVVVFDYAWKPFYLSNHKDENAKQLFSKVLTYFTIVSSFIFLTASLFMKYAVQIPMPDGNILIPQEFWSGLGIIPIIIGGYYFNGVYSNIAAGFLIEKKTKYLPYAFGIGAVLNVLLNIFLIPVYSYWASAWATLAAYFVGAMVLYIMSRKIYPVIYEWKKIIIMIGLGVIAIYISNEFSFNSNLNDIFFRTGLIAAYYVLLISIGIIKLTDIKKSFKFLTKKKIS